MMPCQPDLQVSDPEISPKGAIGRVDIDVLVESRVQQKLQELLGPILIRLLQNGGNNLQGSICEEPFEDPNVAQQRKEPEAAPDNQAKPEGISFFTSNVSKGNELSAWNDPRKPPKLEEAASSQDWLTVTKVVGGDSDAHEIKISDKALRDCIKACLLSFIAHRGANVWLRDEVVLISEIDTLVFNYKILEAEAHRQPADKTRNRLRELLEILRAIHGPPILMCIDADISKDFRIEIEFVWPLFCPGKLIVANTDGFDSPQLLRIDNYHLKTKDQQTSITVSAWMWDWDGQKLVRSMYEFIKKSPEHGRVNPKEWDFYPVECYEARDGNRGLNALRQDTALGNRRHVFIEYTGEYAAKYRGANFLRYSGDAFGDATAFPPSGNLGPRETLFGRLFGRLTRDERPESKLIKVRLCAYVSRLYCSPDISSTKISSSTRRIIAVEWARAESLRIESWPPLSFVSAACAWTRTQKPGTTK